MHTHLTGNIRSMDPDLLMMSQCYWRMYYPLYVSIAPFGSDQIGCLITVKKIHTYTQWDYWHSPIQITCGKSMVLNWNYVLTHCVILILEPSVLEDLEARAKGTAEGQRWWGGGWAGISCFCKYNCSYFIQLSVIPLRRNIITDIKYQDTFTNYQSCYFRCCLIVLQQLNGTDLHWFQREKGRTKKEMYLLNL